MFYGGKGQGDINKIKVFEIKNVKINIGKGQNFMEVKVQNVNRE